MKRTIPILMLVFLVTTSFGPAPLAKTVTWQDKVDAWLLGKASQASIKGSGPVEFLVFLSEQADLSGAAALETKQEKGAYVFHKLTETARRTQAGVIQELASRGTAYRSFWVANMLWVKGDLSLIQAMAERADVAHVYANPQVQMQFPQPQAVSSVQVPQSVQWNLSWVNADKVWAAGYTGQGVVVAGADTGINWQHVALETHYRGWNGSSADHNNNWHDAIHSSGAATVDCPDDSPQPCDVYGHGTHTMGTMLGDDGAGTRIGMAPEAKWIGCRNMDNNGSGTPARYTECFEWFIAPYALNADPTSGDTDLAPDVVNNSWGCPQTEGCTNPDDLLTVVDNVRAAGILVVASAGNSGPFCSTIDTPIALYDSSFTVGATQAFTDTISGFSSRGPVTADGSNRLKPDVVAPGESIYSSFVPGNSYRYWGGTSMAAPHVAGLAALLISADPNLSGQVDGLETIIKNNTVPLTDTQNCGGTANQTPNNVYGWGRIDARASFQALPHYLHVDVAAQLPVVAPGALLTYTLSVTHQDPLTITHGVILTDVIPIGTTFITATTPYTVTNGAVRWDFASLGMKESRVVSLTLQVPITARNVIVNRVFVSSQEVPLVAAEPVTTTVGVGLFFPLAAKSP